MSVALLCRLRESSAQVIDPDKVQLLASAEDYYEKLDYLSALGLYKQSVSESPSEEVRKHLKSDGIGEVRLKVNGYGESTPSTGNETEEERVMNRRTEIRMIEE